MDPQSGEVRRHHVHEKNLQNAVKEAIRKAGVAKAASCHTFRHSFATHLLDRVKRRSRHAVLFRTTAWPLFGFTQLGHGDIKTTMIYLQTVPGITLKEAKSPLDIGLDTHAA